MSEHEMTKRSIDRIPQQQPLKVISYPRDAAVRDDTPNAKTLQALAELDCGGGVRFAGSTDELFRELLSD